MSHPNARVNPEGAPRPLMEAGAGWPCPGRRGGSASRAPRSGKWVRRYHGEGEAGLRDRCSRPRRSPGIRAAGRAGVPPRLFPERGAAAGLPVFLSEYDHARPHGGIGRAGPASRP